MAERKMTMGVIIGNRGFFPDQLAKSGREEMIQALAKAGMDCVVLGPEDSKHGAVETHEEAKRCAALFQNNEDCDTNVVAPCVAYDCTCSVNSDCCGSLQCLRHASSFGFLERGATHEIRLLHLAETVQASFPHVDRVRNLMPVQRHLRFQP